MLSRSLFVSFFVLSMAACATPDDATASNGGSGTTDESNVSAAGAVTMENWLTHPSVKRIRTEVMAIDDARASLTKTDNPGCDGTVTKYADGEGRIRKIVEVGGEGGFSGTTTAYYGTSGKLWFLLDQESDTEANRSTEARMYFDESGNVLWHVVRDKGGADRIPRTEEKYERDALHTDPAAWFKTTGCAR